MTRIALISTDFELRATLRAALQRRGFEVTIFTDVGEALPRLARGEAALAILDVARADDPAIAVSRIRHEHDLPLLVLGDDSDETCCIATLEAGSDDFIAAPPRQLELVARVRALLRRMRHAGKGKAACYRFADCVFDTAERRVHGPQQKSVRLTLAEGRLLTMFVESPQRVLTRERLISGLHGSGEAVFDRSIDMRVSRLRRRLRSVGVPAGMICTERNLGYVLQTAVDHAPPLLS
ncbi:MAG: response regulator transcription factor [Rudaea sp.]|uniref:response regulator transcription factor n=1 Tax=unclassified Rudaea TaxID=2627037 RepID=UPI0014857268|nr:MULTISPECIES: response regulator transcription factor [unclassified Rudaea]MBN8884897.1 response regulator transcription factor [Rudaea sp.]MBR0344657.1 response regulator transcription factor [Rudaea sp.]